MSGGIFAMWGNSKKEEKTRIWHVRYSKLSESESSDGETSYSEPRNKGSPAHSRRTSSKATVVRNGTDFAARENSRSLERNNTMSSSKDKKQNDLEIREEVLAEDETKDISVYLATAVGTFGVLSAIIGGAAVIALRSLSRFRPDIGGYWMACLPFIFPGITGATVAFKRERTALSVHVAVMLAAFLGGGSCYGYSVEPVFFENQNCTDIYRIGECDRPALLYMYLACGGVATGLSLLGLLLSFCACSNASKRVAKRKYHAEELMYQEQEKQRQDTLQAKRMQGFNLASSIQPVSEKAPIGNDVITPAANGMTISTVTGDMNKVNQSTVDNVTTRL